MFKVTIINAWPQRKNEEMPVKKPYSPRKWRYTLFFGLIKVSLDNCGKTFTTWGLDIFECLAVFFFLFQARVPNQTKSALELTIVVRLVCYIVTIVIALTRSAADAGVVDSYGLIKSRDQGHHSKFKVQIRKIFKVHLLFDTKKSGLPPSSNNLINFSCSGICALVTAISVKIFILENNFRRRNFNK